MNIAAMPLSRKKIRNLAFELRKITGCDENPYFPIVQFIEWVLANPENNMGMEFEVVEPFEMEDTYGTTNTSRNIMRIRSDVYEGAIHDNPRDRFTLCHELGHYILRQPENISYARGDIPVYQNPEWQANTFAAELLAPADLVKDMSIEEMATQCVMSRQAATIQYKELHKY